MGIILGIDEAGRGSWAGPLVVSAVVLRSPIPGLKDSKKLSKLQRKKYFDLIQSNALSIGIGWSSAKEIDRFGLTKAEKNAMQAAVDQITCKYDQIIIDGRFNFLADNPLAAAVVDADATMPVVSAASIIAKVTRDIYMGEQAELYPNYLFDSHVGYGTKLHVQALINYGPCAIHRLSYKPLQQYGL